MTEQPPSAPESARVITDRMRQAGAEWITAASRAQDRVDPEILAQNVYVAMQETEQPASPAAADYTERAREIVRKYIELGVKFVVGPNVYAEWMKNDIADALSAVASDRDAAAIRAFGSRVWSDTEEAAYRAGVSDTRARLREPDVREAVARAMADAYAKHSPDDWGTLVEADRDAAAAAIARIAEMLK